MRKEYIEKSSNGFLLRDEDRNLIVLTQALKKKELQFTSEDIDVIRWNIETELEYFANTSIGPLMKPITGDDILIDKVI